MSRPDPFFSHNGTYHYWETRKLLTGLKYYITQPRKENVNRGYVSFGVNWEQTRFYLGDAAIQYYHFLEIEKYHGEFDADFEEYILKVSNVLYSIIKYYMIDVLEIEFSEMI